MQPINAERAHNGAKDLLTPMAFILGVFLLVFALLFQIATYANGVEVMAGGVALSLTINADACFLYLCCRGGWVIRAFAFLCGLAALANTLNLMWWAAMTIHR